MTYHEEGVLNGCLVHHGSEEVITDGKDHQLFQEAVAHHELLGCARNVPVVVQDAHARETSHLHLQGDVSAQVDVDLYFANRVGSHVVRATKHCLESLVSNLVDHCINLLYPIINYKTAVLFY